MSPARLGFHLEVVSDLVVFILTASPVPVQGPSGRLIHKKSLMSTGEGTMDAPTNWSQSWEREVRGTAPRRHQRSEGSARDSVERPVHGPVAGPNWALSLLRVETEKDAESRMTPFINSPLVSLENKLELHSALGGTGGARSRMGHYARGQL